MHADTSQFSTMRLPAPPLAVTLKGGRDYVQGSQQIARAAEALSAATLISCGFRRLTDRVVVMVVLPAEGVLPEDRLGEAVFSGNVAQRIAFVAGHERAPAAPDTSDLALIREDDRSVPLEGRFSFAGAGTFEARLEVVIKALKLLHEPHLGYREHAIFTGLRAASLTCAASAGSGRLGVEGTRILRNSSGWQSIARVSLEVDGAPPGTFVASFAATPRDWRNAA